MTYVIHSLPRCRTYWLSKLLTYGEWHCGHDEIAHVRSMDDVRSWFAQPCTGTVETGSAWFWRLVPENVRQVVIRRPVEQVIASLHRQGFGSEVDWLMRRQAAKLDQIAARVPGVVVVDFDELASAEGCRKVWEACLPYPFDPAWWAAVAGVHMERDVRQQVRYAQAHADQMAKMVKIARHMMLAKFRRPVEIEGVTIQQEPFDTFYRDAQRLFADHLVQVGEAPDAFSLKNIPLHQLLYDCGCLQVTTARSNGRIFGYLMAVISPSLEAEDETWALHTTFFSSKEFPNLGMKLQRASVSALRDRGISAAFWRAGPRGDGPRMGSLYRRLGAADDGEFFKLDLRNAA